MANLPMATSTSLLYLVPAFAVLIGFVWLGEAPLVGELLGGVCVGLVAGGGVLARQAPAGRTAVAQQEIELGQLDAALERAVRAAERVDEEQQAGVPFAAGVRSLLVELVRRAMADEPECFVDRSLCADSIGKRFECLVF